MSSWKKTGGINYSSKFNTIRVQNAVASSSSVIKEIGEKIDEIMQYFFKEQEKQENLNKEQGKQEFNFFDYYNFPINYLISYDKN